MKLQDQRLDQCVWFFDYDGSLCPHHEVWEPRNYDTRQIFDTLLLLEKKGSEVLWNTGRRIESLSSIEEKYLKFSGYFVQGSVHWDNKKKKKTEFGPSIPASITQHYEALFKKDKKYRTELKPTGMRVAPLHLKDLNALKKILEKNPTTLSDKNNRWEWHHGHRGSELLPVNFNKGTAIEKHLGSGNKKVVVAIGDDLLDKHAAEVALNRGGYFIAVGGGCGWVTQIPHRPEQLIYFDQPQDVLDFLNSIQTSHQ